MELKNTACALCDDGKNFTILHHANLPEVGLSHTEYAPRRERDFVHFQIVRCNNCSLVRSNPMTSNDIISEFYKKSDCSYTLEKENEPLKKTYGKYLQEIINTYNITKNSYLDIGCSNGFMLEHALDVGFSKISGFEPSVDAINQASKRVKNEIIQGMFNPNKFENSKFDLVSFFQTFDHIIEPNNFLQDVKRILKKDGYVIAINHNIGALSYRILKEKSPIIDIGHAYLYDLITMKKIFEKNGFQVLKVFPVKNNVTFSRLLELLPINENLKHICSQFQKKIGIEDFQMALNLGNLGIFARNNTS